MNASSIIRAVALAAAIAAAAPLALADNVRPAGEVTAFDQAYPPASTKTREQRKAETLAANRNGGLGSPGAQLYYTYNVAPRLALAHSTKTRAERKAETMDAIHHGQLMGAGEAG